MKRTLPVAEIILANVIFFLIALVTIIAFLTVVGPESRDPTFYIWLSIVCAAELIIFVWSEGWVIEKRAGRRVSGAARITVNAMIGIWLLITIVVAFTMTAAPKGRYQDYVSLIYLVLTLLFLIGASTLYARDLGMQDEAAATQMERFQLRAHAFDVFQARQALRRMAASNPELVSRIDRLSKRLDGINTSLDYVSPAKAGTWEEEGSRFTAQITSLIITKLDQFSDKLRSAEAANQEKVQILEDLESRISEIESLLAQRQTYLLS